MQCGAPRFLNSGLNGAPLCLARYVTAGVSIGLTSFGRSPDYRHKPRVAALAATGLRSGQPPMDADIDAFPHSQDSHAVGDNGFVSIDQTTNPSEAPGEQRKRSEDPRNVYSQRETRAS